MPPLSGCVGGHQPTLGSCLLPTWAGSSTTLPSPQLEVAFLHICIFLWFFIGFDFLWFFQNPCDHEPHEALIRYSTGCFSMPGFELPSGAGDPWRDHCVSDQVRCPRLPRFHGISWNLMDPLANSKQKSL